MFEKNYFIFVLGLCLTTCYQMVKPEETYSVNPASDQYYHSDYSVQYTNSPLLVASGTFIHTEA